MEPERAVDEWSAVEFMNWRPSSCAWDGERAKQEASVASSPSETSSSLSGRVLPSVQCAVPWSFFVFGFYSHKCRARISNLQLQSFCSMTLHFVGKCWEGMIVLCSPLWDLFLELRFRPARAAWSQCTVEVFVSSRGYYFLVWIEDEVVKLVSHDVWRTCIHLPVGHSHVDNLSLLRQVDLLLWICGSLFSTCRVRERECSGLILPADYSFSFLGLTLCQSGSSNMPSICLCEPSHLIC